MFKKIILSALIMTAISAPLSLAAGSVDAQEYYGRPWHHHHGYGGVIAGGLAAGLVGGLIGGALINSGDRSYAPAPPQPECWNQRQSVQDRYDDGYHYESARVCN
jgi:hypothetical protein